MATPILTSAGALKQLKAIEQAVKANPKAQSGFAHLSGLVEFIFDKKTPTYALNLKQTDVGGHFDLYRQLSEPDAVQLQAFLEGLSGVLLKRGYRSNLLTTQEHQLKGSSAEYKPDSYVPIGLALDQLTLSESRRARQLQVFDGATPSYYGVKNGDFSVTILLEELDSSGRTKQDPRLISESPVPYSQDYGALALVYPTLTISGLPHVKSSNYPYRRD
ncbi:Uncharacterised protein [uncultured archaeon]|nr:Uncharacterised protein [uncultured archaeon]